MQITINGASFAEPPSTDAIADLCPPEVGLAPFALRAQFRSGREVLGIVAAEAPSGGWVFLSVLAWNPRRETVWERRKGDGCIYLRNGDPRRILAEAFAGVISQAWKIAQGEAPIA